MTSTCDAVHLWKHMTNISTVAGFKRLDILSHHNVPYTNKKINKRGRRTAGFLKLLLKWNLHGLRFISSLRYVFISHVIMGTLFKVQSVCTQRISKFLFMDNMSTKLHSFYDSDNMNLLKFFDFDSGWSRWNFEWCQNRWLSVSHSHSHIFHTGQRFKDDCIAVFFLAIVCEFFYK